MWEKKSGIYKPLLESIVEDRSKKKLDLEYVFSLSLVIFV
jgi:hypothetical protein